MVIASPFEYAVKPALSRPQESKGYGFKLWASPVTSTGKQMSSVQKPGWLFDIWDYTTQLYGDDNAPM